MTNVLILGAAGQIARVATSLFLQRTDVRLTLYLRHARRLKAPGSPERVRIVEGDVLDQKTLEAAMTGQDVVYANLDGDLEPQARGIVTAMQKTGLKRLIFISSMGIHDEVAGEHHGSILDPYRNSARFIEASDFDYTILRPAWLNNRDEGISVETPAALVDLNPFHFSRMFKRATGTSPLQRYPGADHERSATDPGNLAQRH